MQPSESTPHSRLDRLENYLRDDPANPLLLEDAFSEALRIGEFDRAEFHLRHAQSLAIEPSSWGLREAHWLIAQRRFPQARARLHALGAQYPELGALQLAVVHDLAQLAHLEGDSVGGLAILQPLLDQAVALAPVTQALALRLMHRVGRHADGLACAAGWEGAHSLGAEAMGVAALMALDASEFDLSQRWADHALQLSGGSNLEALVARASTALAQRDSKGARELLGRALAVRPMEGRTWSALGFCELLEQEPRAALLAFDRAVSTMPEHIGTWHGMGWAAIALGDLDRAAQAFDTALGLDRNFAESHGAVAVVHALRGDRKPAGEAIELAMRLDRANLSAHYAQAVLDGKSQDAAALNVLARRLLQHRPAPFGRNLAESAGLLGQAESHIHEGE